MADEPEGAGLEPGSRSTGYRSRTALLFAISEIVGKLASFGTFAVASRVLGPSGFGDYSWAFALGAIVASHGMFGFDMALIQLGEQNRNRVSDYLSSSLALRLAIGVVSVAIVTVMPLTNPDARSLLVIMTVALSLENLSTGIRASASTVDRQRGAAVVIIVQRLVTAVVSISALLLGFGVIAMGVAYLVGTAIGVVSLLFVATRIGVAPHVRNIHRDSTIALCRKAVLPGMANIMNMPTARLDIVALERRGNQDAVGYFGAAFQLVQTSLFVSDSLIRAAVPALLYAKEPTRVGEIVRAALATNSVFYFPLAVALSVRGGDILALLFGSAFAEGGKAMPPLAIGLLAWITLSLLTTTLLTRHQSKDVAWCAALALVVKLIIVWPLVNTWGIVGAGVSFAIAFTVQAAALWWRLSRYGARPKMGVSLLPAAIASMVMAPVAYYIPSIWLAGFVSLVTYGACWWLLAHRLDPGSLSRVKALVRR